MSDDSKLNKIPRTFEEVQDFYLQSLSDRDKLKLKMHETVMTNPEEHAALFALFILNSNDPFYFLGGATYDQIGRFIDDELFKKVCLHLLSHFEHSKDFWFDIQQMGRWVNQDFVARDSEMNPDEQMIWMVNKMMDYFEAMYKIKRSGS